MFQAVSLDSLDSVSSALSSCRRAVEETEEGSDARKELVAKLVGLRIR